MDLEIERERFTLKTGYLLAAVILHCAVLGIIWAWGRMHSETHETVIPIELKVVVNENLDGNENEQPPPDPPPPPPPPPEPVPQPQPEPVPQPEPQPVVPDAIVRLPPTNQTASTTRPKPPERPKPVPPTKTPQQLREERIAKMRESLRPTTTPPRPATNGRTDRRPPNWQQLLNQGYRPSNVNAGLDASETQRCHALIEAAFKRNWEIPPWTDKLQEMRLEVSFGRGGTVLSAKLVKSSTDATADASVRRAAAAVKAVRGLTSAFIEQNPTVTIRYKVTPQ